MRETLVLNVKPFSINAMYYRDGKIKTADAREWEAQVCHQLSFEKNQAALQNLREFFDPKQHSFTVHITALYPKEIFLNKEGSISARTQDCTNFEKPLVDVIFSPRFFDKPYPYGCKNINHDDRYIARLISQKKSADEHQIIIKIKINKLPNI